MSVAQEQVDKVLGVVKNQKIVIQHVTLSKGNMLYTRVEIDQKKKIVLQSPWHDDIVVIEHVQLQRDCNAKEIGIQHFFVKPRRFVIQTFLFLCF